MKTNTQSATILHFIPSSIERTLLLFFIFFPRAIFIPFEWKKEYSFFHLLHLFNAAGSIWLCGNVDIAHGADGSHSHFI